MKLSILILVRNEEDLIEDCLKQLGFADEIIVLDQNSTDNTRSLAKKYATKLVTTSEGDFDKNRNHLLRLADADWVLYLDADERLTPQNIEEIKKAIKDEQKDAYYFPRKNIILGKWVKHGGWWPDYSPRLFKKTKLIKWTGKVHESPQVNGICGYFKNPLIHLSGRSLGQMFAKTIRWADVEADLYFSSNYPQVTILRVLKSMIYEFIRRYLAKRGFLDGSIGLIEAVYQSLHQAIILTYLWEKQIKSQNLK